MTILTLQEQLTQLELSTKNNLNTIKTVKDLEDLKVSVLGKKGSLTDILKGLGTLSAEERPLIGQLANEIKNRIQAQLDTAKKTLEESELNEKLSQETIDVTLPGRHYGTGSKHPLQSVIDSIVEILSPLGFAVHSGPEVESDDYNFEKLNIKADHPARDMHDTFYTETGQVLRTHTSPVQVRAMETILKQHSTLQEALPLKIIAPGKVFRCDSDATHSQVFHQIEALYVDKNITLKDLKATLTYLLSKLFRAEYGESPNVRFRPSYFPFTEPSVEADMSCFKCKGTGCNLCKHTGWIEILGAGMVHRNVFRAVGYNPDDVTGFAFGIGIDRVAMLKYGISDIRLLYENDARFLSQFGADK